MTPLRQGCEGQAPRRIQLSRKAGWRMPEGAVKVDRSTRWGNPFVADAPPAHLSLAECLEKFEELATGWDLAPLRGKDLACWCPPGQPCHADVLLRMANPGRLRVQTAGGWVLYEGDDYSTPAWQPGRHLAFHRRGYRISATGKPAGCMAGWSASPPTRARNSSRDGPTVSAIPISPPR